MAFPDDKTVQHPALRQVIQDVPLLLMVLIVKDGITVEREQIHIILAGCFNRAEPRGERPVLTQHLIEITDPYPLLPLLHPVFIRFIDCLFLILSNEKIQIKLLCITKYHVTRGNIHEIRVI